MKPSLRIPVVLAVTLLSCKSSTTHVDAAQMDQCPCTCKAIDAGVGSAAECPMCSDANLHCPTGCFATFC